MVADVVTNIGEDLVTIYTRLQICDHKLWSLYVCGRKAVTIYHKIVSFLVTTLAVSVFVTTSLWSLNL